MSQVLLLELPWPSFSHKADFLLPFVFHLWKIILLLKGFVIDPPHSFVYFEGRLLMFGQHQRGKSEVWEICLHVLSVNPEIWIKNGWQWAFRMQLSIDLMKVSWQQMLSNGKLIQIAPYVWSGTGRVSQLKEQLTGYRTWQQSDKYLPQQRLSNSTLAIEWGDVGNSGQLMEPQQTPVFSAGNKPVYTLCQTAHRP